MTSRTSVDLSFEEHEMVILGTEYAGEMKKGVFTIMNYLMPKRGLLPMHCSATMAKTGTETSLLFGLSGTGKTTLSADPQRRLIGDDEHVWSDIKTRPRPSDWTISLKPAALLYMIVGENLSVVTL
jgi:phosphoenolpyruvate carboxykinase (ATP)